MGTFRAQKHRSQPPLAAAIKPVIVSGEQRMGDMGSGQAHECAGAPESGVEMTQRLALATVAGLLMACESFDPSYGAQPSAPPPAPPVVGSPGVVRGLSGGPGNLELTGHLEGQLHGISLSGETTQNYGLSQRWEGGGYLDMNVAVGGPDGAGMILLGIDGGMDHPLFTDGRWASSAASGTLAFGASSNLISVTSCAGPVIGEWPYEQSAVSYELTAEPDPTTPGSVVLVVGAAFPTDESAAETSDVSAVIRFTAPE